LLTVSQTFDFTSDILLRNNRLTSSEFFWNLIGMTENVNALIEVFVKTHFKLMSGRPGL